MRNIDLRTRGRSVRAIDPAAFFEQDLPARLEETGGLAGRGAQRLGVDTLAIEVEGTAHTLALERDALGVRPGEAGASTLVGMERDAFSDLMDDFESTLGSRHEGDASHRAGSEPIDLATGLHPVFSGG